MAYQDPLPEPDEVALRAAVILGASAAVVVDERTVLGTFGIDLSAMDEVEEWLVTDPVSATSQTGRIRRIARATWPGLPQTEVWVLGSKVKRLPLDAYLVLTTFLEQLSRRAA